MCSGGIGNENAGMSMRKRGWKARAPKAQGFPGKVSPPGVSRSLRRGREAWPMGRGSIFPRQVTSVIDRCGDARVRA